MNSRFLTSVHKVLHDSIRPQTTSSPTISAILFQKPVTFPVYPKFFDTLTFKPATFLNWKTCSLYLGVISSPSLFTHFKDLVPYSSEPSQCSKHISMFCVIYLLICFSLLRLGAPWELRAYINHSSQNRIDALILVG